MAFPQFIGATVLAEVRTYRAGGLGRRACRLSPCRWRPIVFVQQISGNPQVVLPVNVHPHFDADPPLIATRPSYSSHCSMRATDRSNRNQVGFADVKMDGTVE